MDAIANPPVVASGDCIADCTADKLLTLQMAATKRLNNELIARMTKVKATTKDPIELLRASCLERGASGIKGLGRYTYKLAS